jgi:hypothetical protein
LLPPQKEDCIRSHHDRLHAFLGKCSERFPNSLRIARFHH